MTLPKIAWAAFVAVLAAGCTGSTSKTKDADADPEIRKAFTKLQTAVKSRSGEKIWEFLDSDSQQDADRVAKAVRESFAKADPAKKQELVKKVGLSEEKFEELNGRTILESELFYRFDEHDELADVKGLEKIDVKGNTAKVSFKDPDNEEKMMSMKMQREEGHWRFQVAMPKAPD